MNLDSGHIIYLLPGLGANYRAYIFQKQLALPIEVLDYFEPGRKESMDSYTDRLIAKMDQSKKISIIGNSFGGMLAVEIAKKIPLHRLVLVSSVKTAAELPPKLYLNRYFGVYRLISGKQWQYLAIQLFHLLGARKGGQVYHEIRQMVHEVPAYFVEWGVHQVLNWTNKIEIKGIVHIHGDKDELFPIGRIKNPIVVKGGSHLMIFTKHAAVNKLLMEVFGGISS